MGKWVRILAFIALNNIALFAGAVIFMYIEYKYTAVDSPKNFTQLQVTISKLAGFQVNKTTLQDLINNIDDYVHSYKECKSRRYESGWKKLWNARTFIRWCYFTYTVITTIGYGDVVVESDFGKLFLGIYALLGIPLHLYTSFLVGKVIISALKNVLRFIEFRMLRRVTIEHEAAKVFVISFMLSVSWTLICSLIIVKSKDWPITDALYFSYVSMLTIGFGDLTIDLMKDVYLHLHLYIGTSLLASIINGIVELLKRPQDTGEYDLSNNKQSISLVDTHQYRARNSIHTRDCYIQNGNSGDRQTLSSGKSFVVGNHTVNSTSSTQT